MKKVCLFIFLTSFVAMQGFHGPSNRAERRMTSYGMIRSDEVLKNEEKVKLPESVLKNKKIYHRAKL